MDLDWCKKADEGIAEPDVKIMLTVNEEILSKRGDYGKERYEKLDF